VLSIFWSSHQRDDRDTAGAGVDVQRDVTPYRDSVDGTRDRVTYQKVGYSVTLRACSVPCRYLAVASKG